MKRMTPCFPRSMASTTDSSLLNQYADAERMLMDDAVAFPLLAETSYFVMGSGVSGIEFYPYGGKVIFRDALAMR